MIEYLQIYSLRLRFPRRETDKVNMLALGSRCWRWTRIANRVRIPVFDVLTLGSSSDKLTLGSRRWISRCWRWVQHVLVGFEMSLLVGFEALALGSRHRVEFEMWRWLREVAVGVWGVGAATKTSRLVWRRWYRDRDIAVGWHWSFPGQWQW